jgi:sulfur-oxidizing protein SoxY
VIEAPMKQEEKKAGPNRRELIASGAGMMALLLIRPAQASDETMRGAIRDFIGEAQVRAGRIKLDLPPLVENGNAVPLTVSFEGPMTAQDHVKAIAVFNQKNPQPNVATFHLGPRSGRAAVSTRIRLADSQTVTAIAQMSDGSFWSDSADVVVTLAACVEGL